MDGNLLGLRNDGEQDERTVLGRLVGTFDGEAAFDGVLDGLREGFAVGVFVGVSVGLGVGDLVGGLVGETEGRLVGCLDLSDVGDLVVVAADTGLAVGTVGALTGIGVGGTPVADGILLMRV